MSFWPFPTTLLTELSAAAAFGPIVDIGAGTGQLCVRLGSAGLRVVALDLRAGSLVGLESAVAADAMGLPFATHTVGACLLANVLRHLPAAGRTRVAQECARVLRPGGRVVVLEDDVQARDPAERNYRRVMDLLARFDASRGPVRSIDELTAELRLHVGASTVEGVGENEVSVIDALAPLRWMRGRVVADPSSSSPALAAELDAIEASVLFDGLRYGRFAYRVFVSHDEESAR